MAIYMKVDGIEGHVSAKGYDRWVELDSLDFGVNRSLQTKPGNVFDRESTKPSVTEIAISKLMDKTSPHIFLEACIGRAKSKVEIHICQTGERIIPYMEYTLHNVLISHYGVQAIAKDGATVSEEHVSFNFDKIEMKYTPYDEKHNPQSPIPAGYDLKAAQRV